MSTKCRAWLVGAVVGGAATGYIHNRFIQKPQDDMLLSLRHALMSPELIDKHRMNDQVRTEAFPFFSRETLNLVLISISDRFIFRKKVDDTVLE